MFLTNDFQVVVLVGGLGTRLGTGSAGLPKSMADVHGKPFFFHQLELMKWHGCRDFVLLVGFQEEAVWGYFKDGKDFGVTIRYSSDKDRPLGTAGALKNAAPLLNDDFLLVYGDSYMDTDYSELIYQYRLARASGKKMLLAVYRNRDAYDKSNVIFKEGRLLTYNKGKPDRGMDYIDYGISVMSKELLGDIPPGASDLSDLYQSLVENNEASGYEVRNRFYEIGTSSSLAEFRDFISRRSSIKSKAVFLDRDGTINETVYNQRTKEEDSPLSPDEVRLIPGVTDALKTLSSSGYLLIVITNQPAAAKDKATLADLYAVNNRVRDLLAKSGVALDDLLMCPHHPAGAPTCKERYLIRECECRKPRAGLFLKAIEKFNIDTERSYAVGDRRVDIDAGNAAGVRGALLGSDYKDLYEFSQSARSASREYPGGRTR